MEDITLINNILNGDEFSFEKLFLKYQLEISKYVYSNIRDNESTKDIVQDIFINVYNKLYTFKQDYKFKTWLYSIARNKCIDYIRKNKVSFVDIDETENALVSKELSACDILELNEFNKHIEECDSCKDEYNFYKEAKVGLKESLDIEGFVFTDCRNELMSKIDKNKYKNKNKNKLRKIYSFKNKIVPAIAACIIGVIVVSNYPTISKYFADNKVSDNNKEITDTVNIKNIDPKNAKLQPITSSGKFIVKEIPKEYGYKEIYDKDNLIVTKSSLEESSQVFLFNVNTGKLDNFISATKSENYISNIKFDGNFVLWVECTKSMDARSTGNKQWTVFAKDIKSNEVFMLKEGYLNSEVFQFPVITIDNGIGTLLSQDTEGNYDKLFLIDLKAKSVKEICSITLNKDYVFRIANIIRVKDKIIWSQGNYKNEDIPKYDIYYYDLKSNEKKQMPYTSKYGYLGSYGKYVVFNDGEKIKLLNSDNSKIVNITEPEMDIFKNHIGLNYSQCFSDIYMAKDYIYFRCDQVKNSNAFIYDINDNIYYSILDKVDSENCHIGSFYCKDKYMILKYSDEAFNKKSLYILIK